MEYALQTMTQPIGVSTYRVTCDLPAPVREELPSVEDLRGVVVKLRADVDATREGVTNEN